jgi:WD40 repeat protein
MFCQVLPQADRVTLLWSDAEAMFPPYILLGASVEELQRLAGQAHGLLAQLGSVAMDAGESAKVSQQLTEIGQALYRVLLQLDQGDEAVGKQVQLWLDRLGREGGRNRLEIIGDPFGIPWTVVFPRFNVLGGRRVQWFRGRPFPEKPAVVLAIDPALGESLPADHRDRLNEFQTRHELVTADSRERLTEIFQTQEVDLLYIFGRAEGDGIRLGYSVLTPQALSDVVFAELDGESASGQTLVFLNSCSGGEAGNLLAAFERFANVGLLGTIQPLAAPLANQCGLEFLSQFLDGRQTVAEAMAAVRAKHPVAALLYLACCPGDVRATAHAAAPEDGEPLSLPDEPYQPLLPLNEDTAALLVGREYDVAQLAGLLDERDTRLVLVHGAAGVGKASLLRAGLVPYLETKAIGYQFLRERAEGEAAESEFDYPVLPIRCSSDLNGQLAIALLEFCARPYTYVTPAGNTVSVDLPRLLRGVLQEPHKPTESLPAIDDLRVALCEDHTLFARVLEAISAQLPFELVLLIENGDELFSLVHTDDKSDLAVESLAILRNALRGYARAKFIMSLRSEYLGQFADQLSRGPEDARIVRPFLVRELEEEELLETVLQPTSQEPLPGTDEAPLEFYGFQFEQGLAEQIAREAKKLGAANQESPLALVHAVCYRLFKLASKEEDKVVRAGQLKTIGGMEKGLSKYVTGLMKAKFSKPERQTLKTLFPKLIVRQPNGTVTRALVLERDVAPNDDPEQLESLLALASAPDTHLLDVSYLDVDGTEGQYVSLGHDALAPVVAQQVDEVSKRSYGWSRMTDGLWITIPLLILGAALAWAQIRGSSKAAAELNDQLKAMKQMIDQEHPRLQGMRWPAYRGQLQAAQQAILAGDLVRARQALIAVKPNTLEPQDDLRGFDWYYLWNQMSQDQSTLYGHQGTVTAVALTNDGQTMATTSSDGTVRLWNAGAGREQARLELKGKNALAEGLCVALSPDGRILAAGGDDGLIRLWKVSGAGSNIATTTAGLVGSLLSTNLVGALCFSNMSTRVSVVPDGEMAENGGSVRGLGFSPDGKTLAAAGNDGAVRLWDVTGASPKVSATLKEHSGPVSVVAFSPDGKLLASGGTDKKVVIWNVAKSSKVTSLEGHPQEVKAVAWSADGDSLATGGGQTVNLLDRGIIKLWDSSTWKPREAPTFALGPVFALAFMDDGESLVTASQDNAIKVFEVATGLELFALRGHLGWARSVAVAHNGKVIASGGFDATARVWQPRGADNRDLLRVSKEPVCSAVFSPDDRWLATGSGDGVIKLWNVASGEEVKSLTGHKGALSALAWAPNGKWLVSGDAEGRLRLWDAEAGSQTFGNVLDSATGHDKSVTSLDWPSKNGQFASGSLDGSAKIWRVEDGKFGKEPVIVKTNSPVYSLVFSDIFELLATGHEDGSARLWNAKTATAQEMIRTGRGFEKVKEPLLQGHTGPVTGMALVLEVLDNHIALWLLTGSADQTLKIRNIVTGIEHNTLRGHAGPITSMAIGRKYDHTLVTGSTDGTIKLWDPQREKERWVLLPQISAVRAVAISTDSRTIAAAGEDGNVRLYRAGKEEVKANQSGQSKDVP